MPTGRLKRAATCHPDRAHAAHGLCGPCYQSATPERRARKNATNRIYYQRLRETGDPRYAKILAKNNRAEKRATQTEGPAHDDQDHS